MPPATPDPVTRRPPLRLWPGIAAAGLIVILRFLVAPFLPDPGGIGILAGLAGTAVIVLWWLFFSRAPWSERIGAIVLVIVAAYAVLPLLDRSIATGLRGRMFAVYALPSVIGPAFVAWAWATRHRPDGFRRVSMAATIVLVCAGWTLFRTDGITGDAGAQFAWRWAQTHEQRLLAQAADDPVAAPRLPAAADVSRTPVTPAATASSATAPPATPRVDPAAAAPPAKAPAADPSGDAAAEWPGFRGLHRNGTVPGVQIGTDWSSAPPVEMWRRPIGPGWSSFAVRGDVLYTQEQRGDDEIVAAYRVSTGQPVWRHRDPARFWESNGGAGPRGTPALGGGRVYAFGATGILNALDARTGAVAWSRNVATDTDRKVPEWGFTSSPLVVGDAVIVAASGTLTGYDAATGTPRWVAPAQRGSYSSPQRATIDGVPQILLLSGSGAAGIAPETGTLLWTHDWPGGTPIIQPALTSDGGILINAITATGGMGTRRLAVARKDGDWRVEERWTSSGLKPYFNDFVVHEGHAYGFDGSILACINLEDGARKWKGGRYGNGQLVLLPEQDLLLVLSEEGEVALVNAAPDKFTEVARHKAIEGKTWNHPVLVRDVLLVRNGEEMAAFRLPHR